MPAALHRLLHYCTSSEGAGDPPPTLSGAPHQVEQNRVRGEVEAAVEAAKRGRKRVGNGSVSWGCVSRC